MWDIYAYTIKYTINNVVFCELTVLIGMGEIDEFMAILGLYTVVVGHTDKSEKWERSLK